MNGLGDNDNGTGVNERADTAKTDHAQPVCSDDVLDCTFQLAVECKGSDPKEAVQLREPAGRQ